MSDAASAAGVSADEALRRAREIAAKLSGGGGGGGGGGGSSMLLGTNGGGGASSSHHPPPEGAASEAAASDAAAAAERKRKRWGVMPPEGAAAAPSTSSMPGVLPGMDDLASILAKKQKQDLESPTSSATELSVHKKVWVSIDGKPRAHYARYLTSKFDEILQKVRQQFGNENDNNSKVLELEMLGKGASKEPPVPGMPEQPLHVLIKGTPSSAAVASVLVEQALLDAQEAEVSDEDYEHEKLLLEAASQRPSASSGAIVAVDGDRSLAHYGRSSMSMMSSSSSTYRPASVAQLIGAHTSNLPVLLDDDNAIEEEIEVPHSVVGLIIGRGGEAIASLQMRTQCKVQIQKESELRPGQTMRLIQLRASTQSAVDAARSHIERLVQERIGSLGGGGMGGASGAGPASSSSPKDAAASKVADAIAMGHSHLQVPVPEDDVGLIIGKQGMTIRSIQDTTGANVQVPPSVPGQTQRLVDVTHPSMDGARAAQQMIVDLLSSKPRGGGGMMSAQGGGGGAMGSRGGMNGAHVTIQVPIPDKDVGLCIGRQGVVIRHMQNATQTRIQITSQPVPGETFRIASISGPAAGCQQVKLMIETIVAEQSSSSVLSGGQLGGPSAAYYGGQSHQQMQPMGGGGDPQAYSADWAAYHAAQAAAAAAAAQQQQQQAATAAVAQQQQPAPPGAEAYQEQFFRYAYYYGEDAARQYYGAWSPPVGTPNPYGVNPNGVQPPPATQSASSEAAPVASAVAETTTASATTAAATIDPSDPLFAATASSHPSAQSAVSAQQQPQQPQAHAPPQARETSRRNVSNLPAWMTKG